MPIILKDYGRKQKKRKEYILKSGLLISGVMLARQGLMPV